MNHSIPARPRPIRFPLLALLACVLAPLAAGGCAVSGSSVRGWAESRIVSAGPEAREGRDSRDGRRHPPHRREAGPLGVNQGDFSAPRRDGPARVGYYFLNRFVDFFDIFTLNAGLGPVFHAEAHATQFFRLGLGGGRVAAFGLSETPREFGLYSWSFIEAAAGPVQMGSYETRRFASTVQPHKEDYIGLMSPFDPLYQEKRDYWSLGGSGGFFLFWGQFEFHPLQLFDWFAGWGGFDPLGDDY